jgi:hypothetical protein
MNDLFQDLCTIMKKEKSTFNFLNHEDVEYLSAFFESKNIPADKTLWKEEYPSSSTGYGDNDRVVI